MKLLHTSDWHLGRMLYGRSLLPDQEYFIDQVFLPAVRQERPDIVLLAGDLFDRQIAPVEAIRLFDRVLACLQAEKIPIAAIPGNHDGPDRLTLAAPLLRQHGIYLATRLEDAFAPVCLQDSCGQAVQIFLLPYCEPAAVRAFLKQDNLRGFDACYRALLAEIKKLFHPSALHILVAHCFVAGSQISESETSAYVGGAGEVHTDCFDGFNYVALGHLHAPQKAGSNGRYSGTPLKYSFDEESHKKSMTVIESSLSGLSTRLLPVVPLRDMRTISGTLDELILAGKQQKTEDFVQLRITDPNPVYLPAERLRPYYPNMLSLHCDWLHAQNLQNQELRSQLFNRNVDDSAVLDLFLSQICGTTVGETDRELFLQACQEVKGEVES